MRIWTLASVFAVLLFFGVFANSYAQELADHVVINEVDTNPPGDDSKSISEWVELYNPTASDVDIGGWKIASTTVTKKTLTLPPGTIIKSGQFLVYSYTTLWFTDVSEKVQLRDTSGNVIDETPVITDQKNDFSSWQRKFDGLSSNAISDWNFKTSSAGSSNGRLETGPATSGALTIFINADKKSYVFADTVTISGNVSKQVYQEKPYFTQQQIKINVDGPGKYQKAFTLYPDANLKFQISLKLDKVLGVTAGTYAVSASYGEAKTATTFSVGDKAAVVAEQEESELTISTDKATYIPGQRVQVSAHTTKIIPLQGLEYGVFNSDGKRVFSGKLYPTPKGDFAVPIFMTTVDPIYGTLEIIADYGTQHARTTFELAKDIKDAQNIVLKTDKPAYGLGETIIISGRSNRYVAALDLEVLQTGNVAIDKNAPTAFRLRDQVTLAGDSSFEYKLNIPSSQSRLGDYRVTVSKEFGTANTYFKIAENPQEYSGAEQKAFVSTDKAIYKIGEKLTILGHVILPTKSAVETTPVFLSVKDEKGKPIMFAVSNKKTKGLNTGVTAEYSFTAIPDVVGNYKIDTVVTKSTFEPKSYIIEAKYGKSVTSTTFSIGDELDTSNVSISAVLDKNIYGLGETIKLEGKLFSGQPAVKISLTKPDGKIVNDGARVDNSKFSWRWTIPPADFVLGDIRDPKTPRPSVFGSYKITISGASETINVFFKVSKTPETDTLETKPLTVTTDKSVYQAGEKFTIIGNAIKRQQTNVGGAVIPDRVNIQVKSSSNKQLYDSMTPFDSTGRFQATFDLPLTVFKDGTYKVVAMYQTLRADTTFEVKNTIPLGGEGKLSFAITTDKESYSPGDTVQITGSANKIVSLTNLDMAITPQEDMNVNCGTVDCGIGKKIDVVRYYNSGQFKYDYKLSNTAKLGTYVVSLDTHFGRFTTTFEVVQKQTPQQPATPFSTVSEKFSRIADSVINVNLIEKNIRNQQVAPSSVQGSLVIVRGSEKSVNIMITADDGTCIIGQEQGCLVSADTKNVGTDYKVVKFAGLNYKVAYSGPDVFLEKFSITPESEDGVIPNSTWVVNIKKDDQPSKFYYEITYKPIQ